MALGDSYTIGTGLKDESQNFPSLLARRLTEDTGIDVALVNLAVNAQALHDEVPAAVAVHPTVVTVWLNVNDLIRGVSAADYEAQLRQLLHNLRRGGQTQVLVGNTPDLGQLPAYRACLPNAPAGAPACLIPDGLVPPRRRWLQRLMLITPPSARPPKRKAPS